MQTITVLRINLFIFYFFLLTTSLSAQPPNRPSPVVVAPVQSKVFVDTLEALGTVKANESVVITSQVTEIVKEVHFSDGQSVNEGDLLVLLDDTEERAQLQEAKVNLEEQKREYRRLLKLVKQNAVPVFEVDAQRSRLKAADAQIDVVKTRIALRRISAPFSGRLGFRNVSQGALVRPGEVMTTLDDLTTVKLDFSVPETFLANLADNQPITAHSQAYPDHVFKGKVSTIDSRVDPVTRAISIRALIDNRDNKLRPGMLLTVTLVKNKKQSLSIPEESLMPRQDKQYVYIVNAEQQVEQREVEIGRRRPGQVEVLSGLEAGMQVITDGTMRVGPGSSVKLVEKN